MAGTKSDGSITIDTKLDNSGFSKGSAELKHAVKSLTDRVNETGGKLQNAFKFDFGRPKQAVNSFSRAIKQVNDEIQSLGELGQRALEGDADALERFRSESGETLGKLEDMKAELEKFGSTEFVTPEYEKATAQYQKAATQVDELAKSLESAEEAFEKLTNDFGSSEEYTALEDRIEMLRAYQEEYEAAVKRGDSAAAANIFMDAGIGKGTIADAVKEAEAEMQKLWDKFENSTPYRSTQREIDKITEKLEQAKAEAARLKAEMDATPATFEGYDSTEYERDQAALENTIDRLLEYRQLVREGTGSDTAPSAEWEAFQERWQNMASVTGVLRQTFGNLFSSIGSGARTAGSAIATGLTHPLQLLDRALAGIMSVAGRAVWSLTKLAASGVAAGIRAIGNAAKSAATHMARLAGKAKEALSHLAGMAKGAVIKGIKKLGNAITGMGKRSKSANGTLSVGFKTMLKYGLGIRSLYMLFNKLRSAITDGFGVLAKYDSQFNKTMSDFKNATEKLRNSFASAFAPLVEAIMPTVLSIINKVSAALSKLGQLFAALTGKNYFMEATEGTTDYAESLDKSSKNTKKQNKESKELQRTLAGFDDVEILKENKKDDEDEEDPDTSGGFRRIPISGAMADLAKMLKDMWKNADFTELGRMLGQGLKDALDKIPWDYIKQVSAKLGKSLATLLNGFLEVPGLFTTIGKTIAEGINTIFEFLDAFASNFHWASLGQAIKDGILGLLYNIDWPLIYHTMAAFGAGIGTALETALNNREIWTAIFTMISNRIRAVLIFLNEFLKAVDWASLGANIANGLNDGIEAFPWDLLAETLINLLNGAFDLWYNFVTTFDFKKFGTHIGTTLSTAIKNIDWTKGGASVGTTITGLYEAVNGFIEEMDWKALGASIIDAIAGGLKSIKWGEISKFASNKIKAFFSILTGAFQRVDWKALPGQIVDAIKDVLENFDWDGVAESAGELIGAAFKAIVDVGGTLWESMKEVGKNIMEGGFQGIIDALADVGSWIKTHILEPFIKGFKTVFGIESPSKEMMPLGGYIIEGMLKGIINGLVGIGTWIKTNIVDPFVSGFKRMFGLDGEESALVSFGKDLISGFQTGISNVMTGISEWIKTTITDPFVSGVKSLFGLDGEESVLLSVGKDLIDGLMGGIVDAMSGITEWIQTTIVDPLVGGIKSLFGLDGEESILFSVGASLLNGLIDGMASIASTIGGWIEENVVGPIQSAFDWVSEAWNNFWGNSEDEFSMPAMEGAKATTDAYRDALMNLADTMDDTTAWDHMSTAMWDMYQNGLLNNGTMEGLQNIMFDVANTGEPFADYTDRIAWLLEQSGVSAEAFNEALGYTPGAVKGATDSMDEMSQKAEAAGDKTSGVGDALDALNGMDIVTALKVALISGAIGNLESSSNLANDQVTNLKQALEDYQTNPTEQSMERLKTAFEQAGVSAGDFKDAFTKAIIEADDETKREMLSIIKTMEDASGDIKKSGDTAGKNLGEGLEGGMKSKEKDVSSEAEKLISDNVLKTMDDEADSHSPSKETHKRGTYLVEGLVEGMKSVSNTVSTQAETIIRDALRMIENFKSQFNTVGSALIQELQNGMNAMSGNLSSAANNISVGIFNSFNSQDWYSLGNNIGQGIYNGLVANSGSLQALAWNTAVDMYNSACRALNIASPSKKFAWIGEMITKGLGGGIQDTQDNAIGAVTSLADAVTREAEEASPVMQIDTALTGFDGVLSTFSDKIVSSFNAMISAMEDIVNGSSFVMPSMANGSVTPYAARRAASQDEGDKLSSLIEMMAQRDADRLTRDDLSEVLANALRQYLNIDFYIGDEQIARHANAGNARLNRRYSTAP